MAKNPKNPNSVGALSELAKASRGMPHVQTSNVVGAPVRGETSFAKSLLNALNGSKGSIERLAFTEDPSQKNEYQSLYKSKQRLIPETLAKRIAIQDDLVAAILNARSNHMSAFGRPQEDRFKLGFKIEVNRGVLSRCGAEQKKEFASRIEAATKLLSTCGRNEGWADQYRSPLSRWLFEQSRNALLFGRFATEVVYFLDTTDGGKRKFHSFRSLDAGTVYQAANQKASTQALRREALHLLEQLKNKKLQPEKFMADEYAWVQVIESRPVQALTGEECLVHNVYPVTDIELQGYPLTPLDTVIGAVTSHLSIGAHNRLFFQSGRATRGMLVIKSEDVDDSVTTRIRQSFNASINNVNNCLHGDSQIITDQGAVTVEAFLDGAETKMTKVWTGTDWQPAMVYRVAEKKELCETHLDNGIEIETSPDHRFWAIGADGDPAWKLQKDLVEGDYLAVNKREASNPDLVPELMGKPLTEEMMEILGWMTGDGTLRKGGVNLFYHHAKERDIWQRHAQVLRDFGIGAVDRTRVVSEEEKKSEMARSGFKSVASERIWTDCYSADLARDLFRLGFTPSSRKPGEGKSIPGFVYALPSRMKASFLRGFFSADGNNAKGLSPAITICHDRLREQTKLLLLSMGIRVTLSEGKTRIVIGPGPHVYKESKSVLRIKDRNLFFEKIGFLQAHKQPRLPTGTNKHWGTSNGVARQTVLKYLRAVKEKTKLPRGGNSRNVGLTSVFTRKQHMDIDAILRDEDSCSLSRLLHYMEVAQISAPAWMTDFNYEPVVQVVRGGPATQMFDVSVYNPNHECTGLLCADRSHSLVISGTYLSNSWRMPVFGIGKEDEITWQAFDTQGGRDQEFQYLSDMNARVILSAFQMSPEELPGYAHLSRGTNNQSLCLKYDSRIYTASGMQSLGEVLNGNVSSDIRVWTGKAWALARVFKTGPRKNCITKLWNGSSLETSPDHRFLSIGADGAPGWVHQSDLIVGSTVLVNKKPIVGVGPIPSYQGRALTPDMMEVLGWLTGDGNINLRFNKNTGNVKQGVLSFFYHHAKERDIWANHSAVLNAFGLGHKHLERVIGDDEKGDLKERYGFKSIAPTRITNKIYDTAFVKWLLSLGFKSSTDGKVIPAFVHALPVEFRQAFLAGLFSADGTCCRTKASAVRVVIHSDVLRHQTRDLLLGLGIRTQFHEGLKKHMFVGTARAMVDGPTTLVIKDKTEFYKQIGFIQEHKQPDPQHLIDSEEKWDRVPGEIVRSLLTGVPYSPNLSRIRNDGCSLKNLKAQLAVLEIPAPSWLDDYHFEEVVSIDRTETLVEMADVEVFDDEHAFVANGMVVHNSESNNSYQLTAHRDVGLRPLIAHFQDVLNYAILPLIDATLALVATVFLVGLDADTQEKESTILQTIMPIHGTMDEVLQKVEKAAIGMDFGGEFPLNPQFQTVLDKYYTVGQVLERFMGVSGAAKDQKLAYMRDPFWFQYQQLLMTQQQMAMQQQAAQQQAAQGGPPGQGGPGGGGTPPQSDAAKAEGAGGDGPKGGGDGPPPSSGGSNDAGVQREDSAPAPAPVDPDLTAGVDAAMSAMTKSEAQLSPSKKRLVAHQKAIVDGIMDEWEAKSKIALDEVLQTAVKAVRPKC